MTRWLEKVRRRPAPAILAAYAFVTLVMTYPLGLRLGTHLFSSTNDFWIYPWNNWWVGKALTQGYDVYFTPYLFYPQGAMLVWHGFSWFNTLMWLPIQLLLGDLAAHNITILLTYVVAGYTAYLLAYEVTGSRPAAFLAGLVYAFYPHRYGHRGQLKLLSNQWTPLVGFFLIRLTRGGRAREGVGLGVALALCGLCGWHQLFLAGLWGGTWLIHSLAAERQLWTKQTMRGLMLGVLVCTVVLAPLLTPMIRQLVRDRGVGLEPSSESGEKQTDLLAFFLPPADHVLFRSEAIGRVYEEHVHFGGAPAAIGWASLVLTGLAVLRQRKAARPWALAALGLALLALGSRLQVNGRVRPIPMPYTLLSRTFVGTFIRNPNRFNIVLALPISVLVALGWQVARVGRARLVRAAPWSTVAMSVLILFEYCTVPVPTAQEPASPFYRQLQEESGDFAVADFPIDLGRDKHYLYTQTLHERPMVGGHISRPPVDAHAFIDEVPLLTAGREGPPDEGELDDVSRQLAPLAAADVRYVMIHKDRAKRSSVKAWRRWFPFRPAYEDDRIIAYRSTPQAGRDFGFIGLLDDGVGIVSGNVEPDQAVAGARVTAELTWGSDDAPKQDWRGEITLLKEGGRVADTVHFEPFEGWETSAWGPNALARRTVTLHLDPAMPGGRYDVAVGLDGGTADPVVIDSLDVEGIGRALEELKVDRRVTLPLGRDLLFLGYAVEQQSDALVVTWHWQALREMTTSYKLFLHLYDDEDGSLVSQVDVVPGNWSYPTNLWGFNEIVSDRVTLPVAEIPPGTYQMAVGAYDAETGRRLRVPEVDGWTVIDHAVVLDTVTVP